MNKNKHSLEQQFNNWITGVTLPTARALFNYLSEYEDTSEKTIRTFSKTVVAQKLKKLGLPVTVDTKFKELDLEQLVLQKGTISSVAFEIGLFRPTLTNLLRGSSRPTLKNTQKLAEYLDVELKDVFYTAYLNSVYHEKELADVKQKLHNEVGG